MRPDANRGLISPTPSELRSNRPISDPHCNARGQDVDAKVRMCSGQESLLSFERTPRFYGLRHWPANSLQVSSFRINQSRFRLSNFGFIAAVQLGGVVGDESSFVNTFFNFFVCQITNQECLY